jgi:hypothetical protein
MIRIFSAQVYGIPLSVRKRMERNFYCWSLVLIIAFACLAAIFFWYEVRTSQIPSDLTTDSTPAAKTASTQIAEMP